MLAAGRAGRAGTAIWVKAAVYSMAYRHDLGLWAPAVGEQCIVYSLYWLDSSADVCVCGVLARPAAVSTVS